MLKWKFLLRIIIAVTVAPTLVMAEIELDVQRSNLPSEITGTVQYLSIDGVIEAGDADKLEAFIWQNNILPLSLVLLNSPGGNLYEGMKIGRIIRRYGLNTQVGYFGATREIISTGAYCYSACTLAYIGGIWRYKDENSLYGIHRFYTPDPSLASEQTAQAASGDIIQFLTEMGINPALFVEMSRTPSTNILVLNNAQLTDMRVINNGALPTVWDIRSSSGVFYVIGERLTQWGVQKAILTCDNNLKEMHLLIIFDTQGRNNEITRMRSVTLSINDDTYRLSLDAHIEGPVSFTNNLVNASFNLPIEYWSTIKNARNFGIYFRHEDTSPYFLGFENMPLKDARSAFEALSVYCS